MNVEKIAPGQIVSFVNGYLTAALWSSSDTLHDADGNETETVELDNYDWAEGEAEKLYGDCYDFIEANEADLLLYVERYQTEYDVWEHAGYDFWLTRNGHGVGYWDRGLGELGQRLTDASKTYGEVSLYLGLPDELVYVG